MSVERDPLITQEINRIRKMLSEGNGMDKLKEEFEKKIKQSETNKMAMERLQKQFEDYEERSFEDAFRELGGKEFSESHENKELDVVLKNLCKLHAGKISAEMKHELFKKFLEIYQS